MTESETESKAESEVENVTESVTESEMELWQTYLVILGDVVIMTLGQWLPVRDVTLSGITAEADYPIRILNMGAKGKVDECRLVVIELSAVWPKRYHL